MEIEDAKAGVLRAGIELSQTGLIARTWGNVSCRVDSDHFVISPSGLDYNSITTEEIVELSIKNTGYEGKIKPSLENKVHRVIYRLRDDAGFIIHTHQHNASAVSAMGKKAIRLVRRYRGLDDMVRVSAYGLPGSRKVASGVAKAVGSSIGRAVIMKNHGAVCYGRNYEEAFKTAHNLEKACGEYLLQAGVDPWDGEEEHFRERWNRSSVVMKYIEHGDRLYAHLDDFAQMLGYSMDVIEYSKEAVEKAEAENRPILVRGKGAMCNARTEDDRIAVSMLIEKNCRAALAAKGYRPMSKFECLYMRRTYLRNYSKLKCKGQNMAGKE